MTSLVARLLVALLALHRPPAAVRMRIDVAHDAIVADVVAASEATGLDPAIIVALGWLESHLGTDVASGGSYGAPFDARHRHIAGSPTRAARIIARGLRLCGSELGAVTFFRTGYCRFDRRLVGYEPGYGLALVNELRTATSARGGGP